MDSGRWPPARVKQLANVSDSRQVIIKLREWARKATGVFLLFSPLGHTEDYLPSPGAATRSGAGPSAP